MKTRAGFTLVEMIIVIMILSVGVLAAAGLQGVALGFNQKAKTLQTTNGIADAEMSLRRQLNLSPITSESCKTTVASGYSCSVTVIPCVIQSSAFACSSSTSASASKAHKVVITVTGPKQSSITIDTIVAKSSSGVTP